MTDTQEETKKNQNELGSVNGEVTVHLLLFCPQYHPSHNTHRCLHCWLLHFTADNRQVVLQPNSLSKIGVSVG